MTPPSQVQPLERRDNHDNQDVLIALSAMSEQLKFTRELIVELTKQMSELKSDMKLSSERYNVIATKFAVMESEFLVLKQLPQKVADLTSELALNKARVATIVGGIGIFAGGVGALVMRLAGHWLGF